MITDKDIKKLKQTFVTKEDLKDELKNLATKDDLTRFATKEDLKNLATKEELNEVKEISYKILNIVDKSAKNYDNLRHEYVAVSLKGDRHEKWINHLADKTNNQLPE